MPPMQAARNAYGIATTEGTNQQSNRATKQNRATEQRSNRATFRQRRTSDVTKERRRANKEQRTKTIFVRSFVR